MNRKILFFGNEIKMYYRTKIINFFHEIKNNLKNVTDELYQHDTEYIIRICGTYAMVCTSAYVLDNIHLMIADLADSYNFTHQMISFIGNDTSIFIKSC